MECYCTELRTLRVARVSPVPSFFVCLFGTSTGEAGPQHETDGPSHRTHLSDWNRRHRKESQPAGGTQGSIVTMGV